MASSDKDKHVFSNVSSEDGVFRRPASSLRNFIEAGGKHPPEKGRYHLYVSYGCPWATRTIIVRHLKGLEGFIDLTVVSPLISPRGWVFKKAATRHVEGADDDPLYDATHLREFYFKTDPEYSGRFTVPMLWDKKLETIVNNESSEIIRMFNTAFNDQLPEDKAKIDIYPKALRGEIDALNEWVYDTVNNGVYKCGFASSQKAYDEAIVPLFASLDRLEGVLKGKDFLVGDQLTEADVRLFVTIIRFDVAYYNIFKCNIKMIRHDYPELNRWLRNLYWNHPVFKDSTNFEHIKVGYQWSIDQILAVRIVPSKADGTPQYNPTNIVPLGPKPDIEPL